MNPICQNPDCGNDPVLYVFGYGHREWFPVCHDCWCRDYNDAPTRSVLTLPAVGQR